MQSPKSMGRFTYIFTDTQHWVGTKSGVLSYYVQPAQVVANAPFVRVYIFKNYVPVVKYCKRVLDLKRLSYIPKVYLFFNE
jgi:hypothetical protein